MLGDLFDTEEQILTGAKQGQVLSTWDRLPRNCADQLKMPNAQRKPGYPIGLKNIGQTCYLNSLLQILFYTPELRKTILDLPLCVDTQQNKSNFFDNPSKHRFMLGFQKLFSEMSIKDQRSLNTEYLKDAFGWQGSEHVQQHDIQQAMKIIFDTFDRALHGTEYQKNIKDLYKGVISQYKNCRNCTVTTERLQDFNGLTLHVKGMQNLQQSMMCYLQAQSMQGDNKIFCETCQSKQDMWLGTKIKTLPNILVFTLRRFTFDYQILDRVKINDFFSFNLEYNLAHLIEEPTEGQQYQLYGVMIHRGSAHGGHYFCFIRDIMQQSDWKKSLQETIQLQKKRSEDRQKIVTTLTEQQKKKKQELSKEEKLFDLPEPNNKKLLQNWFCLDDSICQGIDASKLTTKYQGSQSAYILFYRKKDLGTPPQIKIPNYFSTQIKTQNQILIKQRQEYELKRKQIILKIDGTSQTINLQTKITDFIQIYCPYGFVLVNQAKHNDLPYYPSQINSLQIWKQDQTIATLDLIHQSSWKKYNIDSKEYQQIRPYINKDKTPFQLNVFYSGSQKNTKIVLYQDQILSQLKYRIAQQFGISYQKQIIKLVTPFKQYFVTDDLKNDDVLLTKLGFVHQCQIILKKLQDQGKQIQECTKQQVVKQEEGTMYCFVVERDDISGIKRMYYQKNKTLKNLFDHVIQIQAMKQDSARRFRNLNGDRLFYADQYEKTLEEIKFDEQIVKLRIERGQIPIKGDICVKAKMQSKFLKETITNFVQGIFDPNTSIADVKKTICQKCQLDPEMHKIYYTDWMGEPVRSITKQKQSIFDANFGRQQIVCIRDIQSPIGTQLMYFEIYQTIVGSPEDVSAKFPLKIQQVKTLQALKTQLLQSDICKGIQGLTTKRLRVRQLKRDYMLGNILKNHKNQLKNLGLNGNKLVVQILDHEEQLTENQIVLLLKKRNIEKKIYQGNIQLVFEAGKNPTIQQLMTAARQRLQIKADQEIKIIKYIHYNFEWVQISEKSIDKFLKGKAKPENKKKKNKQQHKKVQEKEKVQENIDEKSTQISSTQEQKVQKVQKQIQNKEQSDEKGEEIKSENQGKKKGKKNKNNNNNNNNNNQKNKQQIKREQCLNLRKAPFLLKDGDWIGYGYTNQLKQDDLQTQQDLTMRHLRQNQKTMGKVYRKGDQKAFKVNLDF